MNFARAGANVTAVDLSDTSLEIARQRAKVFGLERRITFLQANAEELGQVLPRDKRYDLIYSFGVIHHTPRPEVVVSHIRSLLARDGELRLMVYSKASYKLFWILREERLWDMSRIDEVIARNSEAQTGCPVTYTYTFESVRNLLRGFEIVEARKAHIFTWDVEAYKRYEYVKDPAWRNVSDAQLADLEAELGWHLLVTARLLQAETVPA
jgi:ubiquinone/menaquinone biosynthesis C-methylase UbiE